LSPGSGPARSSSSHASYPSPEVSRTRDLTLRTHVRHGAPVEQGSAGLYLELHHEDRRLHHGVYRPTLHAKIYTRPHHCLLVEVSDTGQWMVCEVRPRGRPRVIARGGAQLSVLGHMDQVGSRALEGATTRTAPLLERAVRLLPGSGSASATASTPT
jgi:hypothetical protein